MAAQREEEKRKKLRNIVNFSVCLHLFLPVSSRFTGDSPSSSSSSSSRSPSPPSSSSSSSSSSLPLLPLCFLFLLWSSVSSCGMTTDRKDLAPSCAPSSASSSCASWPSFRSPPSSPHLGGGGGLWGLAPFDLRKSTAVRRLTVRAGAASVDVATSSEGGRSRVWPLRRGAEESGAGASPSHLANLPGRLSSRSGAAPIGLRVGGPGSMSEWLSGGMESEGSSFGGRDASPGKRRSKEAHGQTAYRCHFDSAADINHSNC